MAASLPSVDTALEKLQEEARELFARSKAGTLHRELFEAGGKFLRPRWVLLCAAHGSASGGEVDWALVRRAALAVELVHMGTLYHDDLVDRSPSRRGQPAVHRRHGIRAAALGGAHLIALGNALVADLPRALVRCWGQAALRMAEGQLRDTELAGSFERTPEEFLRNAARKTASIFELAASLGATLGGASTLDREALVQVAHHFGTGFQVLDDLIDFVTDPETQRPPANDLRERTYTLPVLLGIQKPEVEPRLRELLADDGRPLGDLHVDLVCGLLRECAAFEEAAEFVHRERHLAEETLARVVPTPARNAVGTLLERLDPPSALGSSGRRH